MMLDGLAGFGFLAYRHGGNGTEAALAIASGNR
jgi:hypothetical protein